MAVKKTNRTIGKHETRLKYSDETETDNPKGQQTSADNKPDKPLIICMTVITERYNKQNVTHILADGSLTPTLVSSKQTYLFSSSFSSLLSYAVSLCAAIRCFLRPNLQTDDNEHKPDPEADVSSTAPTPTLVYSSDLELAGAQAECAICLSEFEPGETIHVLEKCHHGFHVKCIHKWLSSHLLSYLPDFYLLTEQLRVYTINGSSFNKPEQCLAFLIFLLSKRIATLC
ncbi:hypothetical protein Bca52824_068830 [Brassica carinata]|uniref:RING-type E3 ubiquitin transferase n=1 Tax=Brassica carinata TaxID=52824 RepID=A0A8X7U2E0_BRACI|nr:hypothetical protein Bca52824_068830 [Brassica carinata]